MPAVSIIVPVYNGAAYLRPCLDGILTQTMTDFELILVDDASTDDTPSLLSDYAAHDARIRVVTRTQNGCAGVARNDGMSVAGGEYLLFLDADDVFESSLLERCVARARASRADMVLFGADLFEGNDPLTCYGDPFLLDKSYVPAHRPFNRDDVPTRLFQLCTPEPWTKLFRHAFVEQEGLAFQGLHNANDLYFTLTALALAQRLDVEPYVFVHHRTGLISSVQGCKAAEPLAFLEALRALRAMLIQRGLFDQLEMSFANLVVFHALYNSSAPVLWPRVFVELGVAQHPRSDFYISGDFERYVDLLLDVGLADATWDDFCADVWHYAAVRGGERLRMANKELARVKGSLSMRIGSALTWLPRKLRAVLESGR